MVAEDREFVKGYADIEEDFNSDKLSPWMLRFVLDRKKKEDKVRGLLAMRAEPLARLVLEKDANGAVLFSSAALFSCGGAGGNRILPTVRSRK